MFTRRPFAAALTLALVAPVTLLATSAGADAAPSPTARPDQGIATKHLPRPTRPDVQMQAHDPHTVLVKFKTSASKATRDHAVTGRGARTVEAVPGTGFVSVRTTDRADDLARRLEKDPTVAEVTLDYVRTASATPNDPGYPSQPYLSTVRVPAAWDRSKGSSSMVVAVVDSGVNGLHPDLAGRVLAGYDATTNSSIPAGAPSDDFGHGSMVAGLIGAATNNGLGIAGVAWNARILPVRVLDGAGSGTDTDVIEGVTWAANKGAKVINLSLGGPNDSPALHEAIRYAVGKGAVVVAAAGNSGALEPMYPAAYSEAFAVAATDNQARLTDFSTFGPWVDLAAPGFDIVSTGLDADYYTASGTSFSAPIVSGVAALVRTQSPTLTPAQVVARLRSSARDAGPRGIDPYVGYGVVDAANALGGGWAADFALPSLGSGEPNDLPSRATPLTGSATASLAVEGDVDWYRVDTTTTQPLSVAVKPAAYDEGVPQNGDPVVTVYDQGLRRVASSDHDGPGGPELAGWTAAPGASYIKVENYNGARDARPYTVTLGRHTGRALNAPSWLEQPTPQDGATAVADLTGDGRDDVVANLGAYGDEVVPRGVVVYAQSASGELDGGTFHPTADDTPVQQLDVEDVDGDGRVDVLAATFQGLQVFYQGADGSLGDAQYLAGVQGAQAHDVVAGDLDDDGDADLVTTIYGSPAIMIRQADGRYTEVLRVHSSTSDLAIADVDGDGRPDVVGLSGYAVRVIHNTPSGWSDSLTPVTVPDGSSMSGLQLVDVTRDRRTDVVVVIRSLDGPAMLGTLAQGADGTLGAVTTNRLPAFSETLASGDVTGDGVTDLVTSGTGTNATVSVLPGLSSGGVGAAATTATGDSVWPARQGELSTGDVDGDGRVDAVLKTGSGIAVLHNATASTVPTGSALWVRSTTPSDFGSGMTQTYTPTVTFARDVVPSSVTSSSVRILNGRNGSAVPATVTYDAARRTATVRPASPLYDNAPYRLTVSGVKDTSSATMTTAYSSTFRTVDVAPKGVGAFRVTGALRAATLTWTAPAVNDLDRYVIRMATGSTPPSNPTTGTAVYAGTTLSAKVNLGQGTTYSFRIWAKDRSGRYSAASSARLVGTAETMTSTVTSLTKGRTVTVSSKLTRRDTGGAIAGVPVQLYWRRVGSATWNLTATRTSSSTGAVTFTHSPTASVDYMWVYRGSGSFVGSSSALRRVTVR
ncbi:S8 family serine peptidase [Terrabacter sp. Ter38]|uniref:S8 family serine peptidase n=1 Tax=Terrabacter sp. Ter38 TaxID=2926030 RepID=UPI002118E795|nr:S8 family serine peptidase [Terrabacter sp. Ter38]